MYVGQVYYFLLGKPYTFSYIFAAIDFHNIILLLLAKREETLMKNKIGPRDYLFSKGFYMLNYKITDIKKFQNFKTCTKGHKNQCFDIFSNMRKQWITF